jgi:predicted ATPase/DNA-binding winged helix-turn-helix (wHTH) protein
MGESLSRGFRIGEFTVSPSQGRIVSRAGEVHVEPRAMDVLVALACRPAETLTRDELIEAVWKHPHVSDEALSRCISVLRHALRDDGSHARLIETIPKRGYRLTARVEIVAQQRTSARVNGRDAHPRSRESGGIVLPDWSKTNVALQLTRIIGREAELAEIRSLLAEQRLVTLTGSAGVGKTRLALELGKLSLPDFADGVWLVELAPLSDPALVPATVATVLGVELGHAASPSKELSRRVGERELLLILDNCEHLVDAVASLAETVLGTAPGVRILTTSQVLINIAGEQAYRVPSLAVPNDDRLALDDVMGAAAVQLFVERATSVDSHFGVDNDNAAAIAAICRRLDGIPLALEMAAARAPLLGVEQLAQLLDERFRVLTGGRRTALPRQQTLRATLDWSYDLLPERERIVLARLGVFAGGFTIEAACAVAAEEAIDKVEVIDLLARLISRSLVVADTGDQSKRYRLLQSTREYALERLDESGGSEAVRTRHLEFYLALAEQKSPNAVPGADGDPFDLLHRDRENFLAAHLWCDRAENGGEAGLRLAFALKDYWVHRGGLEAGYPSPSMRLHGQERSGGFSRVPGRSSPRRFLRLVSGVTTRSRPTAKSACRSRTRSKTRR